MSSATTPSSASGLYVPVHKRSSPTGSPMSFVVNELPPVPMAYSIADLLQMRSTSVNEIMRQRLLESCPQIVYDPEKSRKFAENKRQQGGVLSSASSSGAKRRSAPTPSSSTSSSPSSKHTDLPAITHNNHTHTSSNGSRKKKPAHMTIQVPETVISETQIDNNPESFPEDQVSVVPVLSTAEQKPVPRPSVIRKSRATQTTSASSRPPSTAGSATRSARRNNQQRRRAFGHGAFGPVHTATSAHADSWRRGEAVAPVLSVVVA